MSLPKPYGYAIFTKDGQPDADHFSKRELLPADKEAGYAEAKLFTEEQVQALLVNQEGINTSQIGVYVNALSNVAVGVTDNNKIVIRFLKRDSANSQIELGDAEKHNLEHLIYALQRLKPHCS